MATWTPEQARATAADICWGHDRTISLEIIAPDRHLPPPDLDCRHLRKNVFGKTFRRKTELNDAIGWAADALLKGYTVCHRYGGWHLWRDFERSQRVSGGD
jgi:hypothetical protein